MIIQETYDINGRSFVRTYSSAGRYVLGGQPYGQYIEANDPAEFNRTYVEGDLIPPEEGGTGSEAEELLNIILGEDNQ